MSSGSTPTWKMNKVELLAECSRRSLAVDPKWTLTELRHVLAGDAKHYLYREPKTAMPKSISKMTRDELVEEAIGLGIEVGHKEPRGAIMLKIRDFTAPDNTVMTIGEVPQRDLREHPNVLRGMGIRGGEGQRRQHAPRAQEVCHLEAQSEEPSGDGRPQDQAPAEGLLGCRGERNDPTPTGERDRSLCLGMGRGGPTEHILEHIAQDEYATYEKAPRGRHQEDGKGRGAPYVGGDPSARGTTGMSEGRSWSGTPTVKEHYAGEAETCDKEITEDFYPKDQSNERVVSDRQQESHDEEITKDFYPKDQSNEDGAITMVQEDHNEVVDKDIFRTSATEGNQSPVDSGDEPGTRPFRLCHPSAARSSMTRARRNITWPTTSTSVRTTMSARRWPSPLYVKDVLATRT